MAPTELGPYRIVSEIARGGMGVVYRAFDPRLEREVALKVIPPEWVDADALGRFRAEAQAAARLRHPNIVGLLDVGRDQGRPYLVMELVEGTSLQARITREGALESEEAAQVALALAQALRYAHAQGVIHRDLKPHNVLIDAQGAPRLTDFGLARLLDQELRLTRTGEVLGTPVYMSPEQAEGEEVDTRTDVYGLGAILYAMLCGRPPYQASGPLQALNAVLSRPPTAPGELRPVDAALERVCLRCLARAPERRFPDMDSLIEALSDYLRPVRRPPWLHWLAAGAAALLGGGVLLQQARVREAEGRAEQAGVAERAATQEQARAQRRATGLQTDLERRSSLLRQAGSAAWSKDPTLAVLIAEELLRTDPTDVHALLLESRARRARGELEKALEALERALALEPDRAVLHLEHGRTLVLAGRVKQGIEALDRVLALASEGAGRATALRERATAKLRLTRPDRHSALADLSRALDLAPRMTAAWNLKAEVELALGRPAQALRSLNRSLELQPDQGQAYLQRVEVQMLLDRWAEAEADLGRAQRLLPGRPDVFVVRGRYFQCLGRHNEAVQAFDQAFRLGPDSAQRRRLHVLRATSHALLSNLDRAREDLKRSGAGPESFGALLVRGVSLYRSGRFSQSLVCFQTAIQRYGLTLELLDYRAAARMKLGQFALAAEDFDRLSRQAPSQVARTKYRRAAEQARAADRQQRSSR